MSLFSYFWRQTPFSLYKSSRTCKNLCTLVPVSLLRQVKIRSQIVISAKQLEVVSFSDFDYYWVLYNGNPRESRGIKLSHVAYNEINLTGFVEYSCNVYCDFSAVM